VILFSRQSNDWPAYLVSLTLVTYPFISVSAPFLLARQAPQWGWLIALLYSGLEMLSTVMTYVFPDGRFVPRWTRWLLLGFGLWALALFLVFLTPAFDLLATVGGALWFGLGMLAQVYRY